MASPTPCHCPDCGASVKLGERWCWICHRLLPWEGEADKAAAGTTFAKQSARQPVAHFRRDFWSIAAFVAVAIAGVHAVVFAFYVTFFVTCLASASAHGYNGADEGLMWRTSIGAAFVVFVGFVILLYSLGRSAFRKIPV